MDIKMPVKPLGNYRVRLRQGEASKEETCQKLNFTKIASRTAAGEPESEGPTHLIVYYSFGCKRILQGMLKENQENRVVFQVDDREVEFRLEPGAAR
jgi:hypothetical protein